MQALIMAVQVVVEAYFRVSDMVTGPPSRSAALQSTDFRAASARSRSF
jgi:hypothetical protein